MSKIYLPTAEQMDETLANLDKIAGALGSKIDLSSWKGIQTAVRSGLAPELLPIGTQLTVSHSKYGDMVYDVVAHDYLKSAKDENAHTMTLMCHDSIGGVQYDNREAFYYADTLLPAGTYNFTIANTYSSWGAGTYQFTLTQDIPMGGQLCINEGAGGAITTKKVQAFASHTATSATETVTIVSGDAGTNLGTFGVELNAAHRVSYGSNNYKESAIRQFLNSSAEIGAVWSPQTKYDRPPTWLSSLAGFVNGLDEDFLSVIGEVVVPCASNNSYESPDSTVTKGVKYTVRDKFYLASQKEIFGTNAAAAVDGSVLFPYYQDATNADRIKRKNDSPVYWRLRSAHQLDGTSTYYVTSSGTLTYSGSTDAHGCVPVCTIV